MFHPIGSLPPGVYWRRRVFVVVVALAVVVLVALTFRAASGGGGASKAAASTTSQSTSASRTSPAPAPSTSASTTASTAGSSTSPAASTTPAASSSGAVAACLPAQLKVVAATGAPAYKVGDQPVVAMQVTNTGPLPCSTALGDTQIEFRIYNGGARVWGSHDCKIDPTPDVETLPVNTTIAKTVTWSGYSSEPSCAGTRQKVGAGTYTLQVYLDGAEGATAQFTIA